MIPRGLHSDTSDGMPEDANMAAAYWSARRRLGTLGARDEAAFARWMEDPAHRAAFEAADGFVDDMGALAADTEIRRMREAALASYPLRSRWRAASWAMAAMVGLIAIGIGIGRWPDPVPLAPPVVSVPAGADGSASGIAQERGQPQSTEVGQRRDLRLSDGSVIVLNTASTVVVNYAGHERSVQLLRGQALFEVAADPKRPFVVTAGDRRITAVGTAFDVKVDEAGLRVVMVEGRVKVDPIQGTGLDRFIPLLGRKRLGAGEQLVLDSGHEAKISVADVGRDVSWRQGRLIFRHDTLADAVAEINRYSQTQLVVEDPRAAGLRISGVFSTARPENFVSALSAYYPVEARPRAPRVIGLGWRQQPPADAETDGRAATE